VITVAYQSPSAEFVYPDDAPGADDAVPEFVHELHCECEECGPLPTEASS
jgi:hypothetical protein